MQYMTAKQAADNWDLTVRRVQDLCRCGSLPGAVRWGREWMIPVNCDRPADRRRKENMACVQRAPCPRNNPVLLMTNLYDAPGCANKAVGDLKNFPISAALLDAQIAYCQGDINRAIAAADRLVGQPLSYTQQLGCGIMQSLCAAHSGDLSLWNTAMKNIRTAPADDRTQEELRSFWEAAAKSEIYDVATFPGWFTHGCFDKLPVDSFPTARYYYLKYLYVVYRESAIGLRGEKDLQANLQTLPAVAEPLISQTKAEKAVIAEIYLRMLAALIYHGIGNDAMAIRHIDRAIALALPDKLYQPLAEYRNRLDFLLDERLNAIDPKITLKIRAMCKQARQGWVHLHNTLLGRSVSTALSPRELEIARQAAYGISNKEIAQRLHLSVNSVKQALRTAMDKTGATRRSELFQFL